MSAASRRMTSPRRPTIGVFDSGFGGLTVLKALLELIPDADYAYFGDTARLPYGSKSVETVARYAVEAAHFLESHGAQMLVIACNTATALALDRITAAAHVPVVGVIEPGAEAAASATKNQKVVVDRNRGHRQQPRLSQGSGSPRPAGAREGLPSAGSAGRGRMGRALGDRAGREHLSGRGFCATDFMTPTCWCWDALTIRC